tara:strand:- start:28605 stop:29015 length:411 start_codon:yes stop_codon:yes gene_type:complete
MLNVDPEIIAKEKAAGQKARRKLRETNKRLMYQMVAIGETKNKRPGEKSLSETTVKVLMDVSGLDALRIDIPRHGLIHQHGVRFKKYGGAMTKRTFPYLMQTLYDNRIVEELADNLADIRGGAITDLMVKGFPNKL